MLSDEDMLGIFGRKKKREREKKKKTEKRKEKEEKKKERKKRVASSWQEQVTYSIQQGKQLGENCNFQNI